MRVLICPDANLRIGPSDVLTQRCAELLTRPSPTRERLTAGLYLKNEGSGAAAVERAFELVCATQPIRDRLHKARIVDWHTVPATAQLTNSESNALQNAEQAVHEAITVDDFAAEELKPRRESRLQR
jgi:acyl-CoA dehydrogenase